MPERASLICIFPRRRAGRWSWVVVTGAGAGPAPLTGGGPKPVATSHSVAGGRRLGRAPSVPDCDYDGPGADRRYFREGHFLVGTPSPQASPANYNLIYIAGSPGPLYLDGRDGGASSNHIQFNSKKDPKLVTSREYRREPFHSTMPERE